MATRLFHTGSFKQTSLGFALFFLPGMLLIVGIFYTYYLTDSNYAIELLTEKNESLADLQREAIRRDFRFVVSDLLYLAEDNELLETLEEKKPEAWSLVGSNFINLANRKKVYDQIRYLDNSGMERIRVNFDGDKARMLPHSELRMKGGRYYFRQAIGLDKDQVYVSDFDLNVENGEVERPYKPTIRFATPVFDQDGKKSGLLVINYLGRDLLSRFTRLHEGAPDLSHLLNADGYWLHNNKPEQEWGFMFPEKQQVSFAHRYSAEWKRIKQGESGHFMTENGLFAFTTVHPLRPEWYSGGEPDAAPVNVGYHWKIVALSPPADLQALRHRAAMRNMRWAVVMTLLLAIFSLLIAQAAGGRRVAEARKLAVHRISPDSIVTTDHHGNILEFNEAAE